MGLNGTPTSGWATGGGDGGVREARATVQINPAAGGLEETLMAAGGGGGAELVRSYSDLALGLSPVASISNTSNHTAVSEGGICETGGKG